MLQMCQLNCGRACKNMWLIFVMLAGPSVFFNLNSPSQTFVSVLSFSSVIFYLHVYLFKKTLQVNDVRHFFFYLCHFVGSFRFIFSCTSKFLLSFLMIHFPSSFLFLSSLMSTKHKCKSTGGQSQWRARHHKPSKRESPHSKIGYTHFHKRQSCSLGMAIFCASFCAGPLRSLRTCVILKFAFSTFLQWTARLLLGWTRLLLSVG